MANTLSEEAYKAETTTLALCWKIQRADGVALGFTTHDRPLRISNLLFESSPGINSSAIQAAHLDVGTVTEAEGIVSNASITDADIQSGRYGDAKVEVLLVNWTAPDDGAMTLSGGYLGEFRETGSQLTLNVLSIVEKLNGPVCDRYSPECRATFGDTKCRIDLSRHQTETSVTSIPKRGSLKLSTPALDLKSFLFGTARFCSGQYSGLEALIINNFEDVIMISETDFDVQIGDRILLRAGCDKQASTCRNRFSNFLNFRGEPNIPGLDTISGYVVE